MTSGTADNDVNWLWRRSLMKWGKIRYVESAICQVLKNPKSIIKLLKQGLIWKLQPA